MIHVRSTTPGLWFTCRMQRTRWSIVALVLVAASPALALPDEPGLAGPPGSPGTPGAAPGAAKTPAGGPPIESGGHGAPTPGPALLGEQPSGFSGSVGGGAMYELIDGEHFITLDLATELGIGPVRFGVWVPLRLRVYPDGVAIRPEDWDEVSDFARLLRFVEVTLGGESWRFRGRFGSLDGESIGHGTVVAGYYNNIDRDHYQAGLALSTAIKWGGFEFMLDNLLDPEIFSMRVHTRPTSFFTDNSWANRLVVGMSFTSDTSAPAGLETADDPDPAAAPTARVLVLDEDNNIAVADSDVLGVLGVDAEYTILSNKWIDLVPYMDLNFMFSGETGVGFHLGTFFNLKIPWSIGPKLMTRLEYRAMSSSYAPRYIDSTYETQRVQYTPGDLATGQAPLTKLGWLRSGAGGNHGWLGELYFDFAGWVRVGGTYEDYSGPDNAALTLSLLLPKFPVVQLGAFYTKRGFDGFDEAFDLDGAWLVAFARLKIWGPIYLSASYSLNWEATEDGYETNHNASAGAGVSFTF